MAKYTCARCGEEHEEDEDPGYTERDGCPSCEDWIQCEKCGEWAEESTTVNTGDRTSEEWCEHCVELHANTCDHCGDTWRSHLLSSVDAGRVQDWCPTCASRHTWTCDNCSDTISCDVDSRSTEDGLICERCTDSHWYCDECELWFPDGSECNCGDSGHSSGGFRVAGYGCHGAFKIRNNWGTVRLKPPAIGLEMEVGNFPDSSSRSEFGNKVYCDLGDSFAYPTADGSLGEYGIEFIGHPIGAMDHIAMYEQYGKFFDGLIQYDATVNENPSGCHTNFGRDCFVSDEAIRCSIIACVRFFDALMMFTEPECRSKRMTYCKEADLYSGEDPISQCRSNGKYSIVNIKPNEGQNGIVEFRLAGMGLDRDRHLAQIQLYHNLVAWSNKNHENKEAAAYAPFSEIFLPILFQESIKDVIECGEKIGGLPLGDPSACSYTGIGVSTWRGATGYIFNEIPALIVPNTVYSCDFIARPGDIVTIDHVTMRTIISTSGGRVDIGGASIYRPSNSWPMRGDCGPIKWVRSSNVIRYFFDGQYATFPIGNPPMGVYTREEAALPTEFPGA